MTVRLLSLFFTLVVAAPVLAGTFRGRVVDPDQRPIVGARVSVSSGQFTRSELTDARGEFTLQVPDTGTFDVRIAADGFRVDPLVVNGATQDRDLGDVRMSVSAVTESVVVSAAQVEIPLSRASSTITVVTGEELQLKQIHSVADALRNVPGLTVAATGSTGAATSVFPRGGESNYTLVFVDDVPVNAFGGDYDFGHLAATNIERIEVVRGPQSALFGSNAIGGVVRVITRRGGPPAGTVSVEGGGYDTFRVAAATTGAHGAFDWGASLDRLSTDNFNGHVSDAGLTVTNDDYSRTAGAIAGGWRSGETNLRAQFGHAVDDRGFPGPFGSNPIGAYGGIDDVAGGENSRTVAALSGSFVPHARTRVLVQGAYNRLQSDFSSQFGPSESHSNRWLGRGQVDFTIAEPVEVSAGLELQRERTGSTYITGADFQPVDVKRRIAAYFAEGRWTATKDLFVTAGLRIDDIHRERLEESPDVFSPRPVLAADSVVSVNPRVSVAWFLRPGTSNLTKLRASAATGIRPPDGFELAFTDNPELKPERSFSVEGGIEQTFAGGRAQADAVAFYNSYDDLIIFVGSFRESSRYITDNIANARARGFELGLTARNRFNWKHAVDLHGRISYTFIDAEILAVDAADQAPTPFEVGDPLLRRPRHQVTVDAGVKTGRLTAFITGRGIGRALDIEPTFGASSFGGLFYRSAFNVWSTGASWQLHRYLDVFGRIENLFDRDYEEVLGYPALGRRVTFGVRIAANR